MSAEKGGCREGSLGAVEDLGGFAGDGEGDDDDDGDGDGDDEADHDAVSVDLLREVL